MSHGKQLAFQLTRRVLRIGTSSSAADTGSKSRNDTSVTGRQREVLDTIKRLTALMDLPPTLRELMAVLKIGSPNGMMSHLKSLRRKGLVTWDENKVRTLRVIEEKGIPIEGTVT